MKVKDYTAFKLFDYNQNKSNKHQLGNVVIKRDKYHPHEKPEIGVIIQIHNENEFRTDMYGNTFDEESLLATKEEIELYRPELIKELVS